MAQMADSIFFFSLIVLALPILFVIISARHEGRSMLGGSHVGPSKQVEEDRIEPSMAQEYRSVEMVLEIKEALRVAHKNPLPIEIIDSIIDYAEIWVHTSVDTKSIARAQRGSGTVVARGSSGSGENVFVIRSLPVGLLPEQLDGDPNLDEFVTSPPSASSYQEPSDQEKTKTRKLIDRWAEVNCVRGKNSPCRKIVFTIFSHDQGHGGGADDRGTFKGSYTWFDAGQEKIEACDSTSLAKYPRVSIIPDLDLKDDNKGSEQQEEVHIESGTTDIEEEHRDADQSYYILRTLEPTVIDEDGHGPVPVSKKFYHPLLPAPSHIYRNRLATRAAATNFITWSYTDDISDETSPAAIELNANGRGPASGNGNFVRNLKVGDVVTLWAKARFPAWANTAEYCKIDVYWAV